MGKVTSKLAENEVRVSVSSPKQEDEDIKSPKSPKSVKVDIDTDFDVMLKLQESGADLFFETEVDKFKKLSSVEVNKLNQSNKTRYFVAVGMHQQNVEDSNDPFSGLDLKIDSKAYSATEAMEVFGKDPDFNYVWKSPEGLQRAAREGFVPVRDPNVKTAFGQGSEVRKIGAYGKDELILCQQPKELHEKHVKDIAERSRMLEHSTRNQGISEISKAGKVYIPPEDGSEDSKFTLANPDRR